MTHTTDANDRMNRPLDSVDLQIADLLREEAKRQATGLELIPSENLVSEAVLEAMGSIFTNKYAEGYPGKRYYGGCEYADKVEQLAIDRAKELFGAEHANVQSHSGTSANVSVYMSTLQPGDTVLGMNLSHGGHLTHGHPLNFSGRMYKFIAYGVKKEDNVTEDLPLEPLTPGCGVPRSRILAEGSPTGAKFLSRYAAISAVSMPWTTGTAGAVPTSASFISSAAESTSWEQKARPLILRVRAGRLA